MHNAKTGICGAAPASMAPTNACAARSVWQRSCRPPRVQHVTFAKPPAPMAPALTVLPITATVSGMPRFARWLRTGAMLYAGSVTAALIAGTVLWPR
jgi:hypothetical protein